MSETDGETLMIVAGVVISLVAALELYPQLRKTVEG